MAVGTTKMGTIIQYNTTADDRMNLFNIGSTVLPGIVISVDSTDTNGNSVITAIIWFNEGQWNNDQIVSPLSYDTTGTGIEGTWFELP